MPDPLLTVNDLACARGERLLFKAMNFSLNAGELLLVQGGNGQGKTSLLRLLTGLARPEAGEVRWRGESIRRVNEVYHAEMCYLGHANGVKDDLNPVENLRFADGLQGRAFDQPRAIATLERLGLSRCLVKLNEEFKKPLKDRKFLTRDSRAVERKKYGQPKARKRFQFSKR